MAKLLKNAKLTLDDGESVYTFDVDESLLSSTTAGAAHNLSTGTLRNMTKNPYIDWAPTLRDEKPFTVPFKDPAEKAMIGAARAAERAVLAAARSIEKAHQEAEALINDADHTFNTAILGYLHTGKSNLDASRVLEAAGIYATEDRTESVACAKVADLYLLDATDIAGVR